MKYLQNAQYDSRNDKNLNFIIFLENLDQGLHFDIDFDEIHQLEQFLYDFEICF